METLNIHAAKTHFSGLVERVEKGETIIIARAGKPVAKLVPLGSDGGAKTRQRFGFLKGELDVADDFDIKAFGQEEIEEMFYGNRDK